MNKDELLKRKEILEKQLEEADKINDLLTCITIGETLNKIDEKIRNLIMEEDNE